MVFTIRLLSKSRTKNRDKKPYRNDLLCIHLVIKTANPIACSRACSHAISIYASLALQTSKKNTVPLGVNIAKHSVIIGD